MPRISSSIATVPCGQFPSADDALRFATSLYAEERERARDVIVLRTSGGAIASVRIRVWSHGPEFDYVLRLR